MEVHKEIERHRYDAAARPHLEPGAEGQDLVGAAGVPLELRGPYIEFEQHVRDLAVPGGCVLDIGAGTGAFSFTAHGESRTLIATDISLTALQVARKRSGLLDVPLNLVCADSESLPFRAESIDLVASAGVLYCFNASALSREIQRILKPHGSWVIVDSLNENPLYKLNRWVGFLRRRRTALVARNLPTVASIERLGMGFDRSSLSFHGILTFLVPLLRPLFGSERTAAIIAVADLRLKRWRRLAFKVVAVFESPKRAG